MANVEFGGPYNIVLSNTITYISVQPSYFVSCFEAGRPGFKFFSSHTKNSHHHDI